MSDTGRNIPEYLHLKPGDPLPQLDHTPFKAVVVIESEVTPEWQTQVSDWLVQNGCLYMMAWGLRCTTWDDSVDVANLTAFNWKEIPEDDFVMTTWHENETLQQAFWFCEHCAFHETLELRPRIVHVAQYEKNIELLALYRAAQQDDE